ncbi:predicted protein [Naegleria gruberi]|uniref:Predicted protein n=1 Tax=Naegleria gruberi TaxID=5762 RepID=D2VSI7_NAEGR|nr:uncharacterized protein NAEGRDRAFT_51914 [Naegleria gruberi]EFC40128.1 predicted protein [Naegleria gruberi]|eukprot:XP_002672872.1 predicted protein [Naegleria gruberi strain NEG-M]
MKLNLILFLSLIIFSFLFLVVFYFQYQHQIRIESDYTLRLVEKQVSNIKPTNKLNARVFPITFMSADLENLFLSRILKSNCQVFLASYYSFNSLGGILPTFIGKEKKSYIYGHGKKYYILEQFLNSKSSSYIKDDDFIFFADGMDVMFYDNLQRAVEIYISYLRLEGFDVERDREKDWPILFNAEKNRHPFPRNFYQFIKNLDIKILIEKYVRQQNYPKKPYCAPSTFNFINSGVYIARKRDVKSYLRTIFEKIVKDPKFLDNDDQGIAHYVHISNSYHPVYPIMTDCNLALSITTFNSCEIFRSNDGATCQVADPINGARPISIHSAGLGCKQFCPCLSTSVNQSPLSNSITSTDLHDLKKDFGVIVYDSDHDSITIRPVLEFCGKETLFNIEQDKCVYKNY